MSTVKITKGANIKLKGVAEKVLSSANTPESFAIKPTDFHGVTPKLMVKQGDKVKAGSVLFLNKYNDQIKFTSPVSGEITEIVRGAKRKILEVRIKADKEITFEQFKASDPTTMSGDAIKTAILNAGLWAFVKQRPYDVIANPSGKPKAIFISGFDTNPLAPDYDYIIHGNEKEFQAGIDAITKLTDGKVHLNLKQGTNELSKTKNVQINTFSGPHPTGNVGVQIHHIDPINKGEMVWVINPQDVLIIGKFFTTGKVDFTRTIAFSGPQVAKPRYYKIIIGATINNIIADNIIDGENNRFISGGPLTGNKIASDGNLGFYDNSITVLKEETEPAFMGWLTPNFDKLSFSKTFFSWLSPNKEYQLGTSMNGEPRSFVMSGQYESVFPMDILPVHLVKATMIEDIDAMESLGIYEVAPEDFAVCEFGCTSKTEVQSIIREGLDLMIKEVG